VRGNVNGSADVHGGDGRNAYATKLTRIPAKIDLCHFAVTECLR
jgi:hypothetical protein